MKAKIYKVKAHTNEIIRDKFSKIKDLRIAGMVDHPLGDILIIIMCGVICGLEKSEQNELARKIRQTLFARFFGKFIIVKYAEKKSHFLGQVFGIEVTPSKSTIERILDMVDGEEVAEVIIMNILEKSKKNIYFS